MNVPVNFVIGQISESDFELLHSDYEVTSKMILSRDDFDLFHYAVGDRIQVETDNGNRLWCEILELETLNEEENGRVLLIFTLKKEKS